MTLTERATRHVVLTLVGELDLTAAAKVLPAVVRILIRAPDVVTVDLSGVTFCDLGGLRAVREAEALVRASGAGCRTTGERPCTTWLRSFVLDPCPADRLYALTS